MGQTSMWRGRAPEALRSTWASLQEASDEGPHQTEGEIVKWRLSLQYMSNCSG
jgi:hypothetical protein